MPVQESPRSRPDVGTITDALRTTEAPDQSQPRSYGPSGVGASGAVASGNDVA